MAHYFLGQALTVAVGSQSVASQQLMRFFNEPLGHECLDHLDDRPYVLGDPRLDVRRQHTQRSHILVVGIEITGRQHGYIDPLGLSGSVDLVVHVGDVASVDQLIAAAQQTCENVEDDRRTRVADMRKVIDRGATDVHRDPARIGRREAFPGARQRVVQNYTHRRGASMPLVRLRSPV